MGKEIERKWLLRSVPEDLESYPHHVIEQGYLNTSPVVRIRRQDDTYILTYKGGGLMERVEYNLPLDRDSYEHLKEKVDGVLISKTRCLKTGSRSSLIISRTRTKDFIWQRSNSRPWKKRMHTLLRTGSGRT